MISLWVLEHLEGGANKLLTEVHRGSFHKFQALLVHNNANSSFLKHSETTAVAQLIKKPIRKQQQGTCITRLCKKEILIRGCLPVVLVLLSVNRKLVLKPGAASSLHIYSQVLALFRDLP